jgi:hypothetical protein
MSLRLIWQSPYKESGLSEFIKARNENAHSEFDALLINLANAYQPIIVAEVPSGTTTAVWIAGLRDPQRTKMIVLERRDKKRSMRGRRESCGKAGVWLGPYSWLLDVFIL